MEMVMVEAAPEARFWDRIAKKYAASPIRNEEAYRKTLERVRAYLTPEDRMLELGCGTGTTALKLADAVGSILATDVSPAMIEIAERKRADAAAANVEFRATTAFDAALEEGGYDVVTAFNLLHLLEEPQAAMRRARDLLRPGGLFISKTPCIGSRAWLFGPMIAVMRLFGRAPKVRFFHVDGLDRMMRDAGFELVETGLYPASSGSRFIVARRKD